MRAWLAPVELPAAVTESIAEAVDIDTPAADERDAAIDDAKRFRAALADAIDAYASDLLRDIAADVLARELLLAPCDVQAIVSRAAARYGHELVRIRVHSEEAPRAERSGVSTVSDDSLRRGDVVLETKYGSINASLGVRLDQVLARLTA